MYLLKSFSWQELLLGEEDYLFLLEVPFRTAIMYIVTLTALRLIGKRGIMQGVFEIVTIITLGSAAGDPMFYKKVGLLPAIAVFVFIVLMYKITNWLVSRSKPFEHLVEGHHRNLINEGRFEIKNFRNNELGKDEFFSDLRLKNVSQLGQVKTAYVEASGNISVFYYPDEEVKYGLPIFPENLENPLHRIPEAGTYACTYCGLTEKLEAYHSKGCKACDHRKWTKASNEKRVK